MAPAGEEPLVLPSSSISSRTSIDNLQTMTTRVLLALELLVFSWIILAYGQDMLPQQPPQHRRGNREILTIRRVKAQEVPKKRAEQCSSALTDFASQTTVHVLSSSSDNDGDPAASTTTLTEISLHRNGESDACGSAPISMEALETSLHAFPAKSKGCPDISNSPELDKYQVESLLTEFFHQQFDVAGSSGDNGSTQCASTDSSRNKEVSGFLGFCDMGRDRTVPQPDSSRLVEVPSGSLPCRFYTREGVRVASLAQLADLVTKARSFSEPSEKCQQNTTADEGNGSLEICTASLNALELYAVPAGRVFMFAPKYVGEVFELPHVLDKSGNALSLKVLSLSPRVFDIFHFFSEPEAQQLINKALAETSETHKLHRSTTGTTGASVYAQRTSENAWDTHGKLAQTIKRRCMSALGFDEYYESHTDGLQILRYNLTTAYIPHMDYLTDAPREDYDYRSNGRGGNRFATILLYMSDLEDKAGGETVFSKGGPVVDKKPDEVIRELRESGEIDSLKPGSWEETMTGRCRTRLSVTPKKARAVLFYSQFPNGTVDPSSEHGGCPVLHGQKWAANLWAWNAARQDFAHAPLRFGHVTEETKSNSASSYTAISALFFNSGKDAKFHNARLYYHDQYFGELGAGESIRVNTYVSHVWNIKDRSGNLLHTWTINHATSEEQHFTL